MAQHPSYWLAFNLIAGIGPAKLQRLLDYFGSLEAAWHAPSAALVRAGLDQRARENLLAGRVHIDPQAALQRLTAAGIDLYHLGGPGYPLLLGEVAQPPPVLYGRGAFTEADGRAVAVVGTRRMTAYGRQVTTELVRGLVAHGITVVSGLARGVDAVAHTTALEMGGRTIAVLGSGLDEIYPPEHRRLAAAIVGEQQGVVLSEYPLGTRPEAKNFPPRNRIISGLALGVVLIEAAQRSGALITAAFALEQNREVFAVPGPINSPASSGPNRLIQDGAKLVTDVADIIEELRLANLPAAQAVQLALPESAEEMRVLATLRQGALHADELGRRVKIPAGALSALLAVLELKGLVYCAGHMRYAAVGTRAG